MSESKGLITLLLMVNLLPSLAQAEEIDATLQWSRRVELSTPVSGVIVEVAVQVGQPVSKDQVLLRLDTTVREASVAHAKAQFSRQTRLRDEAQRELKRAQELYNSTLLSEHDIELARIAFDGAEADYQKVKTALVQAESDLRYSEIRAPFDALVVQRYAEIGQTVVTQMQATPLLAVAEAGSMIAVAVVSAARAQALKLDQRVSVKVGGKQFEARLLRVGFEPTTNKQSEANYSVVAVFSHPGIILRAGQVARMRLP